MSASSSGRARTAIVGVCAITALGAAGCGSGGGDKSSKKDYYAAIDTFCKDVKGAAARVQKDAGSVQSTGAKDPRGAVRKVGLALQGFADTTDQALTTLRKASVPSEYKSFNDASVKAFDGVVSQLRNSAKATENGDVAALSKLGADLNAAKLPDLPKDVASGAKECGGISK